MLGRFDLMIVVAYRRKNPYRWPLGLRTMFGHLFGDCSFGEERVERSRGLDVQCQNLQSLILVYGLVAERRSIQQHDDFSEISNVSAKVEDVGEVVPATTQ